MKYEIKTFKLAPDFYITGIRIKNRKETCTVAITRDGEEIYREEVRYRTSKLIQYSSQLRNMSIKDEEFKVVSDSEHTEAFFKIEG